ncbi:membrane-bound lytic murein transglycosylase F [Shewanella sp. NFH-SH190041]|uniref:membrane-bound lytic murein transglycosylase MltF n=1 Tax=Shewanella sp. NFH-SH190041 TaxID=2950245 RepID=UPI0021C3ED24|nr:membrane-bound lytic murein transglycosylase MltF [Shewanella sp. NFH-SH190041]BDM63715.1 membrane-bound lytic murein transglycosylase F [Shewanella sp. NFH-SH190041]
MNLYGFFTALLLSTTLTACEPKQIESPSPPEHSVLRVGTLYGPQIYVSSDQGLSGFDYEMADRFAKYLHKPLKMQPYHSIAALYRALEQDEIDLIAAGITDTEARRQQYRLGPPLYQVDQVLVYREGNSPPDNLNQLPGTLAVMADSAFVDTLAALQRRYPNLHWQQINDKDNEELLEMIAAKTLDYTVSDSTSLQINRRFLPELRVGETLAEDQNVVWLLPAKHSDKLMSQLLAFWNIQLREGTLAQLSEKYFGHVQRFDYVDTRAFIRAVENILPKYRNWFEQYAGELDWRKLAATSYQESHWNPRARSPTGVRGMMMLTLPTAKQMGIRNRLDAQQSIRGGAKYLQNILDRLPDSIPSSQRMWFALASYNVGMGHVEDARKLTESTGMNPSAWGDVKQVLPLLQKRKYYSRTRYGYARGSEAVHYVDNIRRYYDTLVWLDKQEQNLRSQQEGAQLAEQQDAIQVQPAQPND